MMKVIPLRRLAAFGAGIIIAAAAACNDDIAGPVEQIGEPLLDMTIGPAGNPSNPSASFTLKAATYDTLTVTLTNLAPLPAGVKYQVLLVDSQTVDSTSNNIRPVSGRLIRTTRSRRPVNRDSSVALAKVDTTPVDGTIAVADTNQTFVLRITNTDLGDLITNYSHVVVVVTASPITAPGRLERTTKRGFLSSRYRDAKGTPSRADDLLSTSGVAVFGSFAIDAAARLPFINAPGPASGVYWGTQVRANFRALTRPPEGFQYAAWLIDDRTGAQVRVGTLLTPVPENESLEDADVQDGPFRTAVAIVEAQIRADADSLGIVFDDYTRFELLLEPKGGTAPPASASAALVMTSQVPPSVSSRHPGAGKVFGTIVSASSQPTLNTTVYLASVSSGAALQVSTADTVGAFRFRTVNTGLYKIYAIPPGGTSATDSANINIGIRTLVDGSTVGDSVFVTLRIP